MFRTELEIINGISSPTATGVTSIAMPGGRIVDFKFLDDRSLLVLWTDSSKTHHSLSHNLH